MVQLIIKSYRKALAIAVEKLNEWCQPLNTSDAR
jgi:chaperonin GroEL (HSP60 family)